MLASDEIQYSYSVLDYIKENALLVASIPVMSALIGWVTKVVAIKMMFWPLEFMGRPPLLGWQGIVPRRAARMASIATDTITRDLISVRDVLDPLDPQRIAAEIQEPLNKAIDRLVPEVMLTFQPGVWESLPEPIRRLIAGRVKQQSPQMVINVFTQVKRDPESVIDLKDMIVSNFVKDKALLCRIFQQAGRGEFAFLKRSGIYFGAAVGIVQAAAWCIFRNPWLMPAFGLFVGYASDWLALKMIFRPKYPTRYLGFFEWQGLFLKRRAVIAKELGELIGEQVVTPAKLIESLLNGPMSDRLYALVMSQVQEILNKNIGLAKPLVVFAVGSTRYQDMKKMITDSIMAELPTALSSFEDYAEEALNIAHLMGERMSTLNEDQFEALLRPAFQRDDWILITVGAALGFIVGESQALILEHFSKLGPPVR